MKHVGLGTLDAGRIALGAMGMSAAYTGATLDNPRCCTEGSLTTPLREIRSNLRDIVLLSRSGSRQRRRRRGGRARFGARVGAGVGGTR